ncbi:MAG: ATP-binding protein [Deltaproteobacteria bacterium]|nr:ATP-binding protein [Deltaproteobacteria bacterium]
MSQASALLGQVVAVSGCKLKGILHPNLLAGPAGEGSGSLQIGGMVKIPTPRTQVFGLVSGLYVENPTVPLAPEDRRLMEINLIGESPLPDEKGRFNFSRGVTLSPDLGAAIQSSTASDLAQVYARPQVANLRIGSLRQNHALPAFVNTDELVGKHFAILGNTGTGKSCGATNLLRAVLQAHPQGHVVLLDPHDEYPRAFGGLAHVIRPAELRLPWWLLTFEEISEVMCSVEPADRQVESQILKQAILAAKLDFAKESGAKGGAITVDTPVPYGLERLAHHIKAAAGSLSRGDTGAPFFRLLSRLDGLHRDLRYRFMFHGALGRDLLAEILAEILRIPVNGQPLSIITLAGLPSEVVDVVVSVLCRLIFDFALWSPEEFTVPVLLVCEEAHRYAPQDPAVGFEPTRRSLSRIAKEGRKYGVSLGLVTQRPSEISEQILSQCNTLFAMRLSNDKDQQFVSHVLPEDAGGLLSSLAALGTRESIVVGTAVSLPMVIRFDELEAAHRPQSAIYKVSQAWQDTGASPDFLSRTVAHWRGQLN